MGYGTSAYAVEPYVGSIASVAYSGSTGLLGSGTLACAGQPGFQGGSSYTGSGTLTTSATMGASGAVGLSGGSALSTAVVPAVSQVLPLDGDGSLALGSAHPGVGQSGILAGDGVLDVTGTLAVSDTVALDGAGGLSATGHAAAALEVLLAGSGVLTATYEPELCDLATFDGSGQLALDEAVVAIGGLVAFLGDGELGEVALVGTTSTVDLAGNGVLVWAASVALGGALAFSGDGGLVVSGRALRDITIAVQMRTTHAATLRSSARATSNRRTWDASVRT